MSSNKIENETGFNRMAYDVWSVFYDTYPNPTVAIDDLFFPHVYANVRSQNVLEIGCGTGRHTVRLLASQNKVTGIDISEGMLAVLRDKITNPLLTLVQGDFLATPIPNAPFDSIATSLVLEHVFDLDIFFDCARRVLRPGGRIYISEIHPARTRNGVFAHFKNTNGLEVHLKSVSHSSDAIRLAAHQNGFKVRESTSINGSDSLSRLNPKWVKYKDEPMIQIWVLQMD